MNQYPLWKYVLIAAVLIVGIVFALPNIFGNNPAVQVKADRDAPVDEVLEGRVVNNLKSVGIEPIRVERDNRSLLLRFADENTQLEAQDLIATLEAQNRANGADPDWRTASANWKRLEDVPDKVLFRAMEAVA